jgi:hypothetical protein
MPAHNWSEWLPFPDPRKGDYLHAPFGPGVYELRHRKSGAFILFGQSSYVAQRMTSLLPEPLGQGHRSNEEKRKYVLAHIDDIEYRTLACADANEARQIERDLKANGRYKFST